jgi:hypothetical protein
VSRARPRWDFQVEDRADYFARLALALGLTGRDIDPDEIAADEDARCLGIDVLGRLAVRGDAAAHERLLLELERPGNRTSVLWDLAEIPGAAGIEGVDDILVRVCEPNELDLSLGYVLQGLRDFPGEGWGLVSVGLGNRVTRNRNMAIRAIGSWPRDSWPPDVWSDSDLSAPATSAPGLRDQADRLLDPARSGSDLLRALLVG